MSRPAGPVDGAKVGGSMHLVYLAVDESTRTGHVWQGDETLIYVRSPGMKSYLSVIVFNAIAPFFLGF